MAAYQGGQGSHEFRLLDNFTDQAESYGSVFSTKPANATVEEFTMSGWRFVGLLAYYVLLSALAALFAAAFATAPYWIWPA